MSIIGVKDLSLKIDEIFKKQHDLKNIQVSGEIIEFKPSGNHAYFTIKEDECTLKCTFWNYKYSRLLFEPKVGMQVICKGNIKPYYKKGNSNYQLSCTNIEEQGEGKYKREFEALQKKLKGEGLFDDARKKKIPKYPKKIGLATSYNSDAYHDLCKKAKERYQGVNLVVANCKVQGEYAPKSIIEALKLLDENPKVDLIILSRGGGSMEDLHCFNDEELSRYICTIKTPIVTGIGHSQDITIADLVADLSTSTPTDAAMKVVINRKEEKEKLNNLYSEILREYKHLIDSKNKEKNSILDIINTHDIEKKICEGKRNISESVDFILNQINNIVKNQRERLDKENQSIERFDLDEVINENKNKIEICVSDICENVKFLIENSKKNIKIDQDIYIILQDKIKKGKKELEGLELDKEIHNVNSKIESFKLDISKTNTEIYSAVKTILLQNKKDIKSLSEDISSLGPDETLKRGYSIITNSNGDIVSNSKELVDNSLFEIRLSDKTVKVHIKINQEGELVTNE